MSHKAIRSFILACSLYQPMIHAQSHEIAITIDDLPFVGSCNGDTKKLAREHDRFMKILQALTENHVPATGFVIANSIEPGQWALLEEFRNNGFIIGNHTYSHANLNTMSAEKYIQEIEKSDKILAPLMSPPKYFRYPYLAEGKGEKKIQVQTYLAKDQYIIAPVTIDSKDYRFNAELLAISWRNRAQYLNSFKKRYLNYIWSQTLKAEKHTQNGEDKQILLIHANYLNSFFLKDIIEMYKQHGYTFISLPEALKSPAQPLNQITPVSTVTPDAPIKPQASNKEYFESWNFNI